VVASAGAKPAYIPQANTDNHYLSIGQTFLKAVCGNVFIGIHFPCFRIQIQRDNFTVVCWFNLTTDVAIINFIAASGGLFFSVSWLAYGY
jgi:hypothetical protein